MGGPSKMPEGMNIDKDFAELNGYTDITHRMKVDKSFHVPSKKQIVYGPTKKAMSAEQIIKENNGNIEEVTGWKKFNPVVKSGFFHVFNSMIGVVIGVSYTGDITGVIVGITSGLLASICFEGL